jgi:hypothetical protein
MYPYVLKIMRLEAAGLDVTENELGKHVQADLGIRNGLNDTNRKGERERDSQSKQEGPPRCNIVLVIITEYET